MGVPRRWVDERPGRNVECTGRVGGVRTRYGQRDLAYLAGPDQRELASVGVARRELDEWSGGRPLSRWPPKRGRARHGQPDLDPMANNPQWRLVPVGNHSHDAKTGKV